MISRDIIFPLLQRRVQDGTVLTKTISTGCRIENGSVLSLGHFGHLLVIMRQPSTGLLVDFQGLQFLAQLAIYFCQECSTSWALQGHDRVAHAIQIFISAILGARSSGEPSPALNCHGIRFEPAPKLGVAIRERENASVIVPRGRRILPEVGKNLYGKKAVINRVWTFIKKNQGFGGWWTADIAEFFMSWKSILLHPIGIAVHLTAHGVTANSLHSLSASKRPGFI
jgi:hypothetical protein